MLSRESILEVNDLPREEVQVPEWGGSVCVRALTSTERDTFEAESIAGKGKESKIDYTNMRARLCVLVICDEEGTALFTPHDIHGLSRKSGKAMDRVFEVAQRLSGMGPAAEENAVKNSDSAP